MKNLSVENLTKLGACKEGISFVKSFGLDQYNFEDLDIEGDFKDFVGWFEGELSRNSLEDKAKESCKDCIVFKSDIIVESEKHLEDLKNFNGSWYTHQYDEKGNVIRYETSDDFWCTWQYDDKGNEIRYDNSDEYWHTYQYDDKGNEIRYDNSDEYWHTYQYDKKGNEIRYETSNGAIEETQYITEGLPEGTLLVVKINNEVVLTVKLKQGE